MPDYGRKLKQIRQSLNLTQEELAKKLGLTYRTYTSYERNENKPPLTMLDMLFLNFDINLNWFISDKGNMFNEPRLECGIGEMFNKVQDKEKTNVNVADIVKQILVEELKRRGL